MRFLTACLLLTGCFASSTRDGSDECLVGPRFGTEEEIAATPRARPDLESVTISATGSFTADDTTYRRIVRDLAAIEDIVPDVDGLTFVPGASQRALLLSVSDDASRTMARGDYHAWDCLNAHYAVWSLDITAHQVEVRFAGVLDTTRVASDYQRLPGVERALPYPLIFPDCSFGPRLCATPADVAWTYVIDDVDTACRGERAWRTAVSDDGAVTVLDRYESSTDGTARPDWVYCP